MKLLNNFKNYFKTILIITHVGAIKEVADQIIEITYTDVESKVEVI
jgi:DNA repair exonuclease SbcCD ATPase subunit